MTEELELSAVHELKETKTPDGRPDKERRLLRIVILTLGLLCLIQATVIIILQFSAYTKEKPDPSPLSSSEITDMSHNEQQNSTQSCFCCNNLLRENQELRAERDRLQANTSRFNEKTPMDDEDGVGSGS